MPPLHRHRWRGGWGRWRSCRKEAWKRRCVVSIDRIQDQVSAEMASASPAWMQRGWEGTGRAVADLGVVTFGVCVVCSRQGKVLLVENMAGAARGALLGLSRERSGQSYTAGGDQTRSHTSHSKPSEDGSVAPPGLSLKFISKEVGRRHTDSNSCWKVDSSVGCQRQAVSWKRGPAPQHLGCGKLGSRRVCFTMGRHPSCDPVQR